MPHTISNYGFDLPAASMMSRVTNKIEAKERQARNHELMMIDKDIKAKKLLEKHKVQLAKVEKNNRAKAALLEEKKEKKDEVR